MKYYNKAVLAAACLMIGFGALVSGCSRGGGHGNQSNVTTGGQSLSAVVNNIGAQPVQLTVNNPVSYTLNVTVTTQNTGAVTSLANTAYSLSIASSDPNVADVAKDSQNTIIVTPKGNGDATITGTVGYQGATFLVAFTIHVSGGSSGNGGNGGSTNPQYELKAEWTPSMPLDVNKTSNVTVSYRDKNVSGSAWVVLNNNQYIASLLNKPAAWPLLVTFGSNQFQFTGSNTTGSADLKIDVTGLVNVPSFSQTFLACVVINVNGGSGGTPGTVYNNLVISANGTPSTGVSFPIAVQADKGTGLGTVTMNNETIFAWPTQADVDAGRVVMDAFGNIWFNVSGATVDFVCVAMGPVQNLGTNYTDERWNVGTVSNTLQLQASGNIPQTKLLFRYVRGSASLGMMKLGIWDPVSGSDIAAQVQAAGGLTFSDANAFEFVNATDDAGVVCPHLKIKKFGRFWIQGTLNGKTTDRFNVLVTPHGDLVFKEGTRYVFDTHVAFGRPYRNPANSAQLLMAVMPNLTRCGAGNIGTTSLFLEDVGNGSGKTMPTLVTPDTKVTDQADGTVWGRYNFVFSGNSGSQDIPDFNYLGSGPNPFDPNSSANKWPQDTVFSRLWSGSISSNGVFRARIFRDPAVSRFTVEARP